jgi:Trk K+ transport system NAD-binding subunit
MTDQLELLVRVTDDESVPKAFDAGADYALSEQRTTARTLATDVHRDAVLHPVGHVRFLQVDADRFEEGTLGEASERSERGSVLVGVQRNGRFHTDPATDIRDDDVVVVAGVDEELREFE